MSAPADAAPGSDAALGGGAAPGGGAIPSSGAAIRLVVTDVDGTLVTDDKVLTPASIAAAARLRAAGVALAVTSSRPPHGLEVVAGPLGLDTPRGGFNGGTIVAADGTILTQICVPVPEARQALALMREHGVDAWVFADGEWLLQNPDGQYVPLEKRTVQMQPRVVDSFDPYIARAGKIVGMSGDFEGLARLEHVLQQAFGTRANAHRSQKYYLDVTHPEAQKGRAVTEIARILGIPLDAVCAIGDQANDLPMFGVAGHSIAMGNGPAAVQAKAGWVSRSNAEEGWAWAIDHYVLPRAAAAPGAAREPAP